MENKKRMNVWRCAIGESETEKGLMLAMKNGECEKRIAELITQLMSVASARSWDLKRQASKNEHGLCVLSARTNMSKGIT